MAGAKRIKPPATSQMPPERRKKKKVNIQINDPAGNGALAGSDAALCCWWVRRSEALLAFYFPTAGEMFGEVLERSERTLTTAGCRLQQAGERAGAREAAYPIPAQPPTATFLRGGTAGRRTPCPGSRVQGWGERPPAPPQAPNDLRDRSPTPS